MASVNWLIFIWAVNIGRVLETSLGYLTTPLVNALLGAVILRERLSAWQIGVHSHRRYRRICSRRRVTAISRRSPLGSVPAFGLYGLLRKQCRHGCHSRTLSGDNVSSAVGDILSCSSCQSRCPDLWPFALSSPPSLRRLGSSPLFRWFGLAMPRRHLRLVTVGFLQYLSSPSISFVLGLFVYHETFTRQHFVTLLLIWIALVLCFR